MPARPARFAIAMMVVGCGRGERHHDPAPPTPAPAHGVRAAAVIDSHVHLALLPAAEELAHAGVAGAVDMGAPLGRAPTSDAIAVMNAGPILTRVGGYPINAWDPGGFGVGCDDAACATALVVRRAITGARLVKIALGPDGLDPALLAGVVRDAHARGLKVAVHALGDAEVLAAGKAGADVLAHTPVEPLSDAAVEAWKGQGRAVVSTLAAFGGAETTVDNLRRLRAAGVIVLYGTDLGNTRDLGPSARELMLLRRAGLDDAAIADAMTTAPARYWGLPLGTLAPGAEASFLVVADDPRRTADALLAPRAVWLRGRRVR
jgi:hypothetical protein